MNINKLYIWLRATKLNPQELCMTPHSPSPDPSGPASQQGKSRLLLAIEGAAETSGAAATTCLEPLMAVMAPRHRDDAERMLRAMVPTLSWAWRHLGTVDITRAQPHQGTPALADPGALMRANRLEGEPRHGVHRRFT